MTLELKLVKVSVTERTEFRCQTPKCPDQYKLRSDDIYDETKRDVTRELEASLSFTLHLGQRISGRKKICGQCFAAICCKRAVADPVCGVEGAPHELSSCLDV